MAELIISTVLDRFYLPERTQEPEPYIETVSGIEFHFLNPKPEEIDIMDIGHSLSNQCRFTGHTSRFYSVAEHSWHVSFLVPPEMALIGLLHDASEGYMTDVPSPVKRQLPDFRYIEDNIQKMISEKYGLIYPFPEEVHFADKVQLMTEANYLMKSRGVCYNINVGDKIGRRPECLHPEEAKWRFMNRFYELTEGQL